MQQISRFASKDQASLLRLAKELVRVFSDRINLRDLRKLSTHAEKDKLGSNKLLQDILSRKIGTEKRAKSLPKSLAPTTCALVTHILPDQKLQTPLNLLVLTRTVRS